jgi:nitroreductase
VGRSGLNRIRRIDVELREVMRTTPASREYTDDDIPDAVLYDILDVARFAPNGGNRQAWRVIVVRDPATKQRIGELYDLGMREYAGHLRAGLVPFPADNDGKAPLVDLDEARRTPLPPEMPNHIATAPVLLVILLDTTAVSSVDSGLGRVPVTTGGSAFPFAQNILLAARDQGLGGHLTSVLARQEPALRELLDVPKEFILATMLPLGRPVRQVTKLRRTPVEGFTTVGSFTGPAFDRGA